MRMTSVKPASHWQCMPYSSEIKDRSWQSIMFARVLVILLSVSMFAIRCEGKRQQERPTGVPSSAIWVGGSDGGVFIDCTVSRRGEPNHCTIYNDGTGDIDFSGKFVIRGINRGANATLLKFQGSDGRNIYLDHKVVLIPTKSGRPLSVPKNGVLSENGVYVACTKTSSKLYGCSLYAAADGHQISKGRYRCDETLSVPCRDVRPKYANPSEIVLQNGGSLKLAR